MTRAEIIMLVQSNGRLNNAERNPPIVVRFDPRTGKSKTWAKLAGPAPFLGTGAGYLWASMGTVNLISRIDPRTGDADTSSATEEASSEVMLNPLTGDGTRAVLTEGAAVLRGATTEKYDAPTLVNGGGTCCGSCAAPRTGSWGSTTPVC